MTDPILTPEVYGDDYRNPQGLAVAKARAASAEPRETTTKQPGLPSGTDLCKVNVRARDVSEAAIIAYWMERYGSTGTFEHHRKHMADALRDLVDMFGYDLVAK